MRLSRTLIALAALLFATACSMSSPDVLAPDATSASAAESGGTGQMGTGNSAPVEPGDSLTTAHDAPADERGGIGAIGSDN